MSKLRVLIVVDVQQCFIEGTLGGQGEEHVEGLSEFKRRVIAYVNKNKDTTNKYDVIVFTKDAHPLGHSSFLPGPFPAHCHDCDKKTPCSREGIQREEKNMSDCTMKDNKEDVDYSTPEGQLEWTARKENNEAYSSKAGNELIIDFEGIIYNEKIMIKDHAQDKFSSITSLNELVIEETDIQNTYVNYNDTNKPYIIRLNKGELCNFDANGAFYYHVEYNAVEGKLVPNDILAEPSNPIDIKKLSTGLAESLLKFRRTKLNKKEGMEIDVCGLVTNICVAKTCITGVKMFEALKVQNVTFKILNEFCYNLNIPIEHVPNAYDQLQSYIKGNKVSFTNVKDAHRFHPKYHTFGTLIRKHPIDAAFRPSEYSGGNRNLRRRISRMNKRITKRKFTSIRKLRKQQNQTKNRKRSLRR